MSWARELCGGSKVQRYGDYRKLFENQKVYAVLIATNDHWNALPTTRACQADKDVHVEKPLGTSIDEGPAAVCAGRKHRRIVQLAHNSDLGHGR
jgi:predicted dehydrogenase